MEQKLTKAAIIESLHAKLGINRTDIHSVIDELFEEIKDGLKDNRVIELRGFGTFEVRVRKGREKARNPKTGDVVAVDRHGVAIFRPGKELKDFVWDITSGSEEIRFSWLHVGKGNSFYRPYRFHTGIRRNQECILESGVGLWFSL